MNWIASPQYSVAGVEEVAFVMGEFSFSTIPQNDTELYGQARFDPDPDPDPDLDLEVP